MGPFPADLFSGASHGLDSLVAACGRNAPAVALLAALVESIVGLGAVVPGGTVVILAGFTSRAAGAGGFLQVAAAAWLGMTLGAVLDYWIGRVAGRRLVPQRAPWRLAARWKRMLRSSRHFMDRWGWWAIAAANLAGPGRSSIAVAAGASRWSFTSFLAGQALASAAWSVLFTGLGFFAAREASHLQGLVTGMGAAIAAMLFLGLAGPAVVHALARGWSAWLRPLASSGRRPAPQRVTTPVRPR